MSFVTCSGKELHSNWMAGHDVAVEKIINAAAHRTIGIAQELNPSRCVDESHPARVVRISSRSPSHPVPRSPWAFSRLSGSPATVRNAKLTASRLVLSW